MKRGAAVLMMLGVVWMCSPAFTAVAAIEGGGELYQVFNALFYEAEDSSRLVNNTDLFVKSGSYLADGSDLVFGDAGDTMRIDLTYRESGWGGELGLWNGTNDTSDSGYQTLIQEGDISANAFAEQWATFTWRDGYTFADTDMEKGRAQNRWSADSGRNLMGEDHFVAFAIEDDALLDVYNRQLFGEETDKYYSAALDDVWLIGFEEHSYDADFNDLVAVVSRPHDLNSPGASEVPLPHAALLFCSGLAATAGLRARQTKGGA